MCDNSSAVNIICKKLDENNMCLQPNQQEILSLSNLQQVTKEENKEPHIHHDTSNSEIILRNLIQDDTSRYLDSEQSSQDILHSLKKC